MDPDAALESLREAVNEYRKADDLGEDAEAIMRLAGEVVEHAVALDEWLSKGGALPDPWENWKA